MILEVDTREQIYNEKYKTALSLAGIKWKQETLSVGDFRIGRIIYERKTVGDFITSFEKGRMFDQCDKITEYITETGGFAAIIVHGNLSEYIKYRRLKTRNAASSLTEQDYHNYIADVMALYPEITMCSCLGYSLQDTIRFMIAVARRIHIKYGKVANRVPSRLKEIRDPIIIALVRACGLDLAKAMLLKDKYKSFDKIIHADETELVGLKGIGPETVKKLKGLL